MYRGLTSRAAGDAQHVDVKGREHALDLFADGAVADHEDGFAGEFFKHDGRMQGARVAAEAFIFRGGFLAAAPVARSLNIEEEREMLEHGEDRGEGPLGR